MKHLILFILVLAISSCASVKELQEAKTCKVWEDQPIGPFSVDSNPEFSMWKGKCALFGLFICKWVKTDVNGQEYFQDANGIFKSRVKIASLKHNKLIYEKSILEMLFEIKPLMIDMDKRKVLYQVDISNSSHHI